MTGEHEADVARNRARAIQAWGRQKKWHWGGAAAALVILPVGLGAVTNRWSMTVVLASAVGCHMALSVGIGWWLTLRESHSVRPLTRAVWMLRLWILHIPWLAQFVLAPPILIAALTERNTFGSQLLLWIVGGFEFLCWLAACIISPLVWASDDAASLTPMGVARTSWRRARLFAWALVIAAGSFLIGGAMWVALLGAVERIIR